MILDFKVYMSFDYVFLITTNVVFVGFASPLKSKNNYFSSDKLCIM